MSRWHPLAYVLIAVALCEVGVMVWIWRAVRSESNSTAAAAPAAVLGSDTSIVASPPAGTPTPNPTPSPTATPKPARRMPLAKLVGQKFMVAYRGTTQPPATLLRRIERGEVGGVILFTDNVPASGSRGIRAVVRDFQRAARKGHNPPLLIATDQEGGTVRRMPGPPAQSPAALARGGVRGTQQAGRNTGRSLRSMGVNVNLAPVADLPASATSFLGERAFSRNRAVNVRTALGFARGLQQAHVAATAKHFPGLGAASGNTDQQRVVITSPRSVLDRERSAFLEQARAGTKLIMVSSAIYTAYDKSRPAVLSPAVLDVLRRADFAGVVISDELRSPALAAYGDSVPLLASRAGVDLLLYANSDGGGSYGALLRDVRAGRISRTRIEEQTRRILALKQWLTAQSTHA